MSPTSAIVIGLFLVVIWMWAWIRTWRSIARVGRSTVRFADRVPVPIDDVPTQPIPVETMRELSDRGRREGSSYEKEAGLN